MQPHIIKKYSARRYYSSQLKRYINLTEISARIVDEDSIQVIDNQTGSDVTNETLWQILMQAGKVEYYPKEILEFLIKVQDNRLIQLWNQFLLQNLRLFLSMQKAIPKSYKKAFAASAAKKT